jgi:hypothetical protein
MLIDSTYSTNLSDGLHDDVDEINNKANHAADPIASQHQLMAADRVIPETTK